MSTWFLVMWMHIQGGDSPASVGPFASRQECEQAMADIRAKRPIGAVCVQSTARWGE